MTNTERILRARIQAVDDFTRPMRRIITQTRSFQSVANRLRPIVVRVRDMASRILDRISVGLHNIRSIRQVQTILRVVDQATQIVKRVTNLLVRFGATVTRASVGVVDKASGLLSSLMGKLSILAGGVTIGVAVKQITGGAMDLESNEISIRHFMGVGNKGKSSKQLDKMSKNYSKWLTQNANVTPFGTQEVMQSGAKSLTSTGGNVKNAQTMLKRAEDMAGLTGKGLDQAVDALMDVNMGQYSRLTEFGISAEGGANGQKPEEILAEIDRRFGGGAKKLGESARGKFSTATGTLEASLANFGVAFLPAMSSAFDGMTKMLDSASPGLMAFSERLAKIDLGGLFASFDFSTVTSALQPVTDLLDRMFTGIETKSPITMGIMQVLGTIFNVVMSGIGAVISAVTPTIESIFKYIGEHGAEISVIIQALGSIWGMIWDTMGVLLGVAWAIIKPMLNSLIGFLATVGQWVKDIGTWWTNMCNTIKNNPITAKINQVWEGVTSDKTKPKAKAKSGRKSAFGTHRVVGNDVPYRLHDGERVMTASDSRQLDNSNSNGVVINVHGMTIREDTDIKRVAKEFVRELKQQKITFAGGY